jgi:Fungalysin metallopeptidase (M36)
MAINFIPNDPHAGPKAPPLRRKTPRTNRPASRAGFTFHDPEPEKQYEAGTPGFLFWQCREAALSAVATWESHAGSLSSWWDARKRLDLYQNAVKQLGSEPDLNAFYDRDGFQFFEFDDGTKTTFSVESIAVVSHEVGHGLLDALRPDLWDAPFLEVNSFHEAFGDSMAILTALADPATRTAVLGVGLGARNFVEMTAEDLSDAVRRIDPENNAAVPRRALNTLKWQLPSSLPSNGGPGELINEAHSFAQVFTACLWDLLRNVLGSGKTSAALRTATRTAAQLLIAGARDAPESARFFQAVGRSMVLADQQKTGGANHIAIRDAFEGHGLLLGANAMVAPVSALAGPAPEATKTGVLAPSTTRDLKGRLNARRGAHMRLRHRKLGGKSVVEAMHKREVPLGSLSPKLRGVVARAPETVLVGSSGGRAAVLGAPPTTLAATTDEVMTYVESLLQHDRIDFGDGKQRWRGYSWWSQQIRTQHRTKVLVRGRFACFGGRRRA